MGKSEEYRSYAKECLELANSFQQPQAQAILHHMAQVWFRLAQADEKSAQSQEIEADELT
jgi:hypothetical protein